MSTSSFLAVQYEETPRYEDAPLTTPTRVSTVVHYMPLIAGRVAAEPQLRDRNNELRGNLSPMPSIVESYLPAGSVQVGLYMSKAVPLYGLGGLLMTATQGDGVNEVQTITATGTVSGGTYDLTITGAGLSPGVVLTAIPWNYTAAQVQALVNQAIRYGGTGFRLGDVIVGGGPLPATPMTITFQGTQSCKDADASVLEDAALTGSTPAYSVSTTTAGSVGTVLLPDGSGIPAGVYRWVSTKLTGATPQAAQIIAAYQENGAWEKGSGFAASQIAVDASGNLTATMSGLVARGMADPGLTPSYDAQAVHPLLSRENLVTWRDGSAHPSEFTFSIANPFAAVPNYGTRSKYPGVLRYSEGFVTMTGTVAMDQYDSDDRDALLEADTFASLAHWRGESKIGATGALYQQFIKAPACQIVGGQGPEDLAAKRNHGAAYNWMAGYDDVTGVDFTITCTNGVSTLATYA